MRREVARGTTGPGGVLGFPTPSDAADADLELTIDAAGFNVRHVRLDGTSGAIDLVAALYPE